MQCTLDVAATGDEGFMTTYLRTEYIRASVRVGP